jgi:hypothetical protein
MKIVSSCRHAAILEYLEGLPEKFGRSIEAFRSEAALPASAPPSDAGTMYSATIKYFVCIIVCR